MKTVATATIFGTFYETTYKLHIIKRISEKLCLWEDFLFRRRGGMMDGCWLVLYPPSTLLTGDKTMKTFHYMHKYTLMSRPQWLSWFYYSPPVTHFMFLHVGCTAPITDTRTIIVAYPCPPGTLIHTFVPGKVPMFSLIINKFIISDYVLHNPVHKLTHKCGFLDKMTYPANMGGRRTSLHKQ